MTHSQGEKESSQWKQTLRSLYKLDLADKDFKASIINMFKEPTDNMLTVTRAIGNIGKEVKSIKKYQMKILELKQIVIKTK